MTTQKSFALVVLAALVALVSLASAPADVPAGTTDTAVLVAAPAPISSPAAPAPAPSPAPAAPLVLIAAWMILPRRAEADGGITASCRKAEIKINLADIDWPKLSQLMANATIFDNIERTLSESVGAGDKRWSLPVRAIWSLVQKLQKRNRAALSRFNDTLNAVVGRQVGGIFNLAPNEGIILIDDGEEDDAGYPVYTRHHWEVNIRNNALLIY